MRLLCLAWLSFALGLTPVFSQAPSREDIKVYPITILVHGGAGYMVKENTPPEMERAYHEGLARALKAGYNIMDQGGSSVDAVETAIRILENDSLFNAGKGAVLNADGFAELDASIMEGAQLKAGAVSGLQIIRNPISAARNVMENSKHVLMGGKGAERFAVSMGLDTVSPAYFITAPRYEDWKKAKEAEAQKKKSQGAGGYQEEKLPWKMGTVGCVALDRAGNLAAGTSTGGMHMKMNGRIGDSPIIGAGTYANNKTCAVSCTGHGEFFIRYAVAHDISAQMEYKNVPLKDAAKNVVQEKLTRAGGTGGIIALDRNGNFTFEFNTPGMLRGFMKEGQTPKTFIFQD